MSWQASRMNKNANESSDIPLLNPRPQGVGSHESPYRYVILAASVAMQICLGATYSWAVFVQPLKALTGLPQGTVQLPFSVFYVVFPATMIFSGAILQRLGPRWSAVLGGILFGGGWLFAGLGNKHFGITIAGIGALGGFGVGLAYIVPISTCIRWFPRNQGLVTGIAVAGFGGGAAAVSQIANFLMSRFMMTPYQSFQFFGAAFLILVGCAGLLMRHPGDDSHQATVYSSEKKKGGDAAFALLYFAMFAGLAAGFTVNANLKELVPGTGATTGALAVSLFAIANALGRVAWGTIFDRGATLRVIQANLLLQAAGIILFLEGGNPAWKLQAFALWTGFNYGGVLVLYASSIGRHWGARQVGKLYGPLFSSNIPAAIAPVLAGYGFDRWASFSASFFTIAGILLVAIGILQVRLPEALCQVEKRNTR